MLLTCRFFTRILKCFVLFSVEKYIHNILLRGKNLEMLYSELCVVSSFKAIDFLSKIFSEDKRVLRPAERSFFFLFVVFLLFSNDI